MSTHAPHSRDFTGFTGPGHQLSTRLDDPFCILIWRFTADEGHVDEVVALCAEAEHDAAEQPKCLFQRHTRSGRTIEVHVGLEDSYGALTHVVTFSDTLKKAQASAHFDGLEIHGPGPELARLRDPLDAFHPLYVERNLDPAI